MKIKPYSLWLTYNIIDKAYIQQLLPPNMKLAKILTVDTDKSYEPKLLFNCYNIDSFWMRGSRLEIMTLAKYDKKYHFVILDCISDTLQWDPINNINGPNGKFKFNYNQEKLSYSVIKDSKIMFDFKGISLNSIRLKRNFAVESNYKCFYRDSSLPVELKFNETEIMKPVRKLKGVKIVNNLWKEYRSSTPNNIFMHENIMHFDTYLKL